MHWKVVISTGNFSKNNLKKRLSSHSNRNGWNSWSVIAAPKCTCLL